MKVEVTLNEIREFILSQDDDRPVDTMQPGYFCAIGDVMVQFGKDRRFDFNYCGISKWNLLLRDETVVVAEIKDGDIFDLFRNRQMINVHTYKQLKEQLI
jgi:hypothetical protein